jgi:hypothetical protein
MVAPAGASVLLDALDVGEGGGLLTARFVQYHRARLVEGARTMLQFADGSPALVERSVDRGRVLLWTSSISMAWNNLPAKPDFVPLMLNAVGSLAPRPHLWRNAAPGDPVEEPLDSAAANAALRTPDGRQVTLPVRLRAGRPVVRLEGRNGPEADDRPGIYEVTPGTVIRRFCINVDPTIGDLRAYPLEALRAESAGGLEYFRQADALLGGADRAPRSDLGGPLLLVLFGVLLVETFAAVRFGAAREESDALAAGT